MPSIKDQSTVDAIARIFCGEGKRNKTETLRLTGYSKGYYLGGRSDKFVWGNERVKKAIKAIDAENSVKNERTLESLDVMAQKAYDLSITNNQPAAAVSATTLLAKMYGMLQADAGNINDTPIPLTKEQKTALKAMARRVTDTELEVIKIEDVA